MRETIYANVVSRIAAYGDGVLLESGQRLLLSSGIPGLEEDGSLSSDFDRQAERAWANVSTVLEAAGMSLDALVRVTHLLVRREDLPGYRAICATVLAERRPASTLFFVAALPLPAMLIELQVEAALHNS